MNIQAVNIYPTELVVRYRGAPYDVYIGRPGLWGNPFSIGTHGSRKRVVSMFKEWIETGEAFDCLEASEERREWILKNVWKLKGKRLGCYCAPLACHGYFLAALAARSELAE